MVAVHTRGTRWWWMLPWRIAPAVSEDRWMRHASQSWLTLLVAVALAGTACGSTVQQTSTALSGRQGNGLSAPQATKGSVLAPGQSASGPRAVAGGSAAVPGTIAGPGGSAVSRPGTDAGPSVVGPSAAAAIPEKGPGWDAKRLYIGVLTVKDLHAVAGSLGIELDPGDTEGQAKAVAAYINNKGGVLGRQVELVFRDEKTVDVAGNPEATGAAACTDFTQDRRVAILYNYVTTLDTANFRACFAKAHIPIFSASSAITDTEATRGLEGILYQTTMVAWDKLAPVLVARLKALGWFGGWDQRLGARSNVKPKLGILSSTTRAGTRVANQIKAALAAAGYPGALIYQWSDASQGQNSSVQYFSGNGVTHIIVTDLELTAFQNSAQSQQYKPRYGISSYNDPYTNLETLSPKGANNGALGIGWAPAYDVSDANDPGETGTGRSTCLKLMAEGGQTFSGRRTARLFAYAACDSILLAVEGARAGRGFDYASIYRGALAVSPKFSTAVSFGNSALTPTHLFTPSSSRDLAWFPECECFRYTSKGTTGRF
jgi:hypothetical protein